MAATEADLIARLQALGIDIVRHAHPPLFTVEESKALRGEITGAHIKNLFLKDKKGALWLVSAAEDRAIDLKTFDKTIGSARLSFGKPDLLDEVLGVKPGAVTPLAVVNDTEGRVTVIVDAHLMQHDVINCHPLHNEATVSIAPADLVTFLRDTGHEPRILDLT